MIHQTKEQAHLDNHP